MKNNILVVPNQPSNVSLVSSIMQIAEKYRMNEYSVDMKR